VVYSAVFGQKKSRIEEIPDAWDWESAGMKKVGGNIRMRSSHNYIIWLPVKLLCWRRGRLLLHSIHAS
jgi:hypothetical protein